jgi:hypothetical protein
MRIMRRAFLVLLLVGACSDPRTTVPAGTIFPDAAGGPILDAATSPNDGSIAQDAATLVDAALAIDAASTVDSAMPIDAAQITCPSGHVLSGGACVAGCPTDMVYIAASSLCVDKYEASMGASGAAASIAGAQPWLSLTTSQADAACTAAGKHLCTEAEWQTGCGGAQHRAFPYGTSHVSGKCNDDNVNTSIVATGAYAGCEGGYTGLFDMSGNAYERTSTCDASGCRIEGGSYRSAASSTLLQCTTGFAFGADTPDAAIGFRCCH